MPRSPTLLLLCATALAAVACADGPESPRETNACDAVRAASAASAASATPSTLTYEDLGPVLNDAASRMVPSLATGTAGADLQRAMTSLATSWPSHSIEACGALMDAVSAERQLPDDDASAADRAALQLALGQAVALTAAEQTR